MTRRRFAALLLALLLCVLPVRAEEELPGSGGFWPGWEDGSSLEGEPPDSGLKEGADLLPGGGILWPGDWEPPDPEPGDGEAPEPEVDPSAWADGTVETARELCAWMRSLGPEGGEITLGATVPLTWEDVAYFDTILEKPAVIHTGPHSLVYDGKGIRAIGQEVGMFQIEGEGVEVPVLELRGDQFFGSDWNEVLAYQEVTASGRDGRGGVAVRVTSDSQVRSNLEYYRTRGRIHAYGAGAVGLLLDVPALVNCLDIDVGGEDSLAIDGPVGTAAFLCKLTAGEGGNPAGAGVNTDSSILSPETEGPRIDRRVGIEPQIPQGADAYTVKTALRLDDVQRYRLTDGNYVDVDLIYDEDFAETIDTSKLGPVDIPVALPEALQGLGLEGEGGLTFQVRVRDPALPVLSEMWQWRGTLTFSTWEGDPWDPETRLWRSDDGGVTWEDAMDWEALTWIVEEDSYDVFQLNVLEVDHPISLVLKNRAGWGNVVTLAPGEDGVVDPGTGGDRDGGDREEQPGGDGGEHPGGGTGGDSGDSPDVPAKDSNGRDEIGGGSPDSASPPAGQTEDSGTAEPHGQTELEVKAEAVPGGAPTSVWENETPAAPAFSAGEQASSVQPPGQAGKQTPEETPSSAETSAVPQPDAEAPPSGRSQAISSRRSHAAEFALPVLALFAAGVLTVLITRRKKRGGC